MTALRRYSVNERKLDVYLGERLVGTLAETVDHRVAFAYEMCIRDRGDSITCGQAR